MLTPEFEQKVLIGIKETEFLLRKELSYPPEFQKKDNLSFYDGHLKKLKGFLETGEMPKVWLD